MNSQPAQSVIDERNRAFRDEMCRGSPARMPGIADRSPAAGARP